MHLAWWSSAERWWRVWTVLELRHWRWLYAVRSMYHATGDALILPVVCLLLGSICHFGHVIEIEEHVIGVGVGLRLHHGHMFFVEGALTMDGAGSHKHLIFEFFHVLLIAIISITRMHIRSTIRPWMLLQLLVVAGLYLILVGVGALASASTC